MAFDTRITKNRTTKKSPDRANMIIYQRFESLLPRGDVNTSLYWHCLLPFLLIKGDQHNILFVATFNGKKGR